MKKVVSGSKLATLMVPDGKWSIVAKLNLDNDSTTTVQTLTTRLIAGADYDMNHIRLGPSGANSVDNMAVAHTVVHTFPGTSDQATNTIDLVVDLNPSASNAFVSAGRLKITAVRVDSITNTPV